MHETAWMNAGGAMALVGLWAAAGCVQSGPPDLLPVPAAHRTVEVSPDLPTYGPQPDGTSPIAAMPEPTAEAMALRVARKPAWWFDGERLEGGERLLCIEALSSDLASARHAVTQAAGGAFGVGAVVEIRELAAAPLAHPGGALRYVAYAMVAQLSGRDAGKSAG